MNATSLLLLLTIVALIFTTMGDIHRLRTRSSAYNRSKTLVFPVQIGLALFLVGVVYRLLGDLNSLTHYYPFANAFQFSGMIVIGIVAILYIRRVK